MNLNNSPTIDELKTLFSHANDDAGHHSLWVDDSGEVHLSVIPADLTPVSFETATPSMKMRYETFCEGNGYVGKEAATDDSHIRDLYQSLVKEWQEGGPSGEVKFVDMW